MRILTLLLTALLVQPPAPILPHSKKTLPAASQTAPGDTAYRRLFVVYGRLEAPALRESSGLVASRRHPGVYWTHNDSGNPPELFAVDEFGRTLGTWRVERTFNYDWEDIALDDAGHLIIADTGNARPASMTPRLLVVDEPDHPRANGTLSIQREIRFRFPDGPRDCEALFTANGRYYVIEKTGRADRPGTRPATLYRVPTDAPEDAVAVAVPIEQFNFTGPVTAADLSRDGRTLAVSTYLAVYAFTRTDPRGPFFTAHPFTTPVFLGQNEAIAFHHDGSGDLLLTCEQRMIYRLTSDWLRSGRPFMPTARFDPPQQPTQPQP